MYSLALCELCFSLLALILWTEAEFLTFSVALVGGVWEEAQKISGSRCGAVNFGRYDSGFTASLFLSFFLTFTSTTLKRIQQSFFTNLTSSPWRYPRALPCHPIQEASLTLCFFPTSVPQKLPSTLHLLPYPSSVPRKIAPTRPSTPTSLHAPQMSLEAKVCVFSPLR